MSDLTPKKRAKTDGEHKDVQKKRKKHKRTSYITEEEKKIVQKLKHKLTPRSTTKLARRLGREEKKVKEWQRVHSPTVFNQKPALQLFSKKLLVKKMEKCYNPSFKDVTPLAMLRKIWYLVPLARSGIGIRVVFNPPLSREGWMSPSQSVSTPNGSVFIVTAVINISKISHELNLPFKHLSCGYIVKIWRTYVFVKNPFENSLHPVSRYLSHH